MDSCPVMELANVAELQQQRTSETGAWHGQCGWGTGTVAAAAPSQPALKAPANPRDLARVQSGLCYYHWRWGNQATKYKVPCTWEN